MSADTSDQLIRLGVGQKVKPPARTDDSSLGSGVCDRLMTEVVSSLMAVRVLRGLRLRRLRVRVEACEIQLFLENCILRYGELKTAFHRNSR